MKLLNFLTIWPWRLTLIINKINVISVIECALLGYTIIPKETSVSKIASEIWKNIWDTANCLVFYPFFGNLTLTWPWMSLESLNALLLSACLICDFWLSVNVIITWVFYIDFMGCTLIPSMKCVVSTEIWIWNQGNGRWFNFFFVKWPYHFRKLRSILERVFFQSQTQDNTDVSHKDQLMLSNESIL